MRALLWISVVIAASAAASPAALAQQGTTYSVTVVFDAKQAWTLQRGSDGRPVSGDPFVLTSDRELRIALPAGQSFVPAGGGAPSTVISLQSRSGKAYTVQGVIQKTVPAKSDIFVRTGHRLWWTIWLYKRWEQRPGPGTPGQVNGPTAQIIYDGDTGR